ncbi:serine hydrolase domain-containing protein [Aquimarina sp. Aq107]|uniref:serine hydrolase domain-containing protein n=1 Tax=Aquimarina sp. Aq107 TaxID=1191912 RepID=UPI00131F20DF|nr:serine hydrolase domain-containing protein [Aquimarina sp. Aq107]
MKKNLLHVLILVIISVSCVNKKNVETSCNLKNNIDIYVTNVMKLHNIPGLAISVIQNDSIIYQTYKGKSSLEQNRNVDEQTLFRMFSSTKLITSTAVFQLIEKGKISLNDKISKYLNNLPLKWRDIRINNLLSHSSGLPDMIRYKWDLTDDQLIEKLSNDEMDFERGNQFEYNQTNYWLLSQIIENVSGLSFAEFVIRNQFNGDYDNVLFSSNATDDIPKRATRYFYNYKTKEFDKDKNNSGARGFSGNGLNITLDEFVKWNSKLDNNELLNSESKKMLWTLFNYKNKTDKFLHGWGIYPVNNLKSVGFSGGNCVGFRKFLDNNTTIILLSNGYLHPAYDIIIDDIARMTIPELKTKDLTLEEDIMSLVVNKEYEKAELVFKTLISENLETEFYNLKWNINGIGNTLNYNSDFAAFDVYNILLMTFPEWWIPQAGLAETYEKQGDTLGAIAGYKRAIKMNVVNKWNYNDQMNAKIKELENN